MPTPSVDPTPTIESPQLTPMLPEPVHLECAGISHIGCVRARNEDQFLIARLRKALELIQTSLPEQEPLGDQVGYLFLVADGMGGHAGGAVASAIVLEEVQKHVLQVAKWFFHMDEAAEQLRSRNVSRALERLDRLLIREGEDNPNLRGMGSTLTMATSIGADLFIVHVGDSRAYLFRDGQLHQLTTDHTLAQKMAEIGIIKPEEVRTHRMRNVLVNAIGGKPGVEGQIKLVRLSHGDRLLLCSDGLTGPVPDDHLSHVLSLARPPKETCDLLLDAALKAGAPDNVTAIVADYSIREEK